MTGQRFDERLLAFLRRAGLPVAPPPAMTAEEFLDYMGRDKKVIDGRLRLVLLDAIGSACITDAVEPDTLLAFLSSDSLG